MELDAVEENILLSVGDLSDSSWWYNVIPENSTRSQQTQCLSAVETCWVPFFKWTNQPADQFTAVEGTGITLGVGQEDRGTVVFFF